MKFLLSLLSALALLRSVTLAAILIDGEDPTIPTISNDFTCQTEEVDKDGNTVLEQLLVWSASARRSLMSARGSLVHGYMEQIKRCDLIPDSGWFSNAAGTSGLGSTWSCTNTSIPVKSELPTNCQYGSFWEINSKESPQYKGVEDIKGTACDRWDYDSVDPNSGHIKKMSFWARHGAPGREGPVATPCATSEAGVYTLYITNFVAGEPRIDQFAPTTDYSCPAASEDDSKVTHRTVESIGQVPYALSK